MDNSTILTSDSEFDYKVGRIQLTNEVPNYDLFKRIHNSIQDSMYKWFLGWQEVQRDLPYSVVNTKGEVLTGKDSKEAFGKFVNGVFAEEYGPTPQIIWDAKSKSYITTNPTANRIEVNGALAPEFDLLLHETYRYLNKLYPDHPDYCELLTNNEINDKFINIADFINYDINLQIFEKICNCVNGTLDEREVFKSKLRSILNNTLFRKYAGSKVGLRAKASELGYNSEVYNVITQYPLTTVDNTSEVFRLVPQDTFFIDTKHDLYLNKTRNLDYNFQHTLNSSNVLKLFTHPAYKNKYFLNTEFNNYTQEALITKILIQNGLEYFISNISPISTYNYEILSDSLIKNLSSNSIFSLDLSFNEYIQTTPLTIYNYGTYENYKDKIIEQITTNVSFFTEIETTKHPLEYVETSLKLLDVNLLENPAPLQIFPSIHQEGNYSLSLNYFKDYYNREYNYEENCFIQELPSLEGIHDGDTFSNINFKENKTLNVTPIYLEYNGVDNGFIQGSFIQGIYIPTINIDLLNCSTSFLFNAEKQLLLIGSIQKLSPFVEFVIEGIPSTIPEFFVNNYNLPNNINNTLLDENLEPNFIVESEFDCYYVNKGSQIFTRLAPLEAQTVSYGEVALIPIQNSLLYYTQHLIEVPTLNNTYKLNWPTYENLPPKYSFKENNIINSFLQNQESVELKDVQTYKVTVMGNFIKDEEDPSSGFIEFYDKDFNAYSLVVGSQIISTCFNNKTNFIKNIEANNKIKISEGPLKEGYYNFTILNKIPLQSEVSNKYHISSYKSFLDRPYLQKYIGMPKSVESDTFIISENFNKLVDVFYNTQNVTDFLLKPSGILNNIIFFELNADKILFEDPKNPKLMVSYILDYFTDSLQYISHLPQNINVGAQLTLEGNNKNYYDEEGPYTNKDLRTKVQFPFYSNTTIPKYVLLSNEKGILNKYFKTLTSSKAINLYGSTFYNENIPVTAAASNVALYGEDLGDSNISQILIDTIKTKSVAKIYLGEYNIQSNVQLKEVVKDEQNKDVKVFSTYNILNFTLIKSTINSTQNKIITPTTYNREIESRIFKISNNRKILTVLNFIRLEDETQLEDVKNNGENFYILTKPINLSSLGILDNTYLCDILYANPEKNIYVKFKSNYGCSFNSTNTIDPLTQFVVEPSEFLKEIQKLHGENFSDYSKAYFNFLVSKDTQIENDFTEYDVLINIFLNTEETYFIQTPVIELYGANNWETTTIEDSLTYSQLYSFLNKDETKIIDIKIDEYAKKESIDNLTLLKLPYYAECEVYEWDNKNEVIGESLNRKQNTLLTSSPFYYDSFRDFFYIHDDNNAYRIKFEDYKYFKYLNTLIGSIKKYQVEENGILNTYSLIEKVNDSFTTSSLNVEDRIVKCRKLKLRNALGREPRGYSNYKTLNLPLAYLGEDLQTLTVGASPLINNEKINRELLKINSNTLGTIYEKSISEYLKTSNGLNLKYFKNNLIFETTLNLTSSNVLKISDPTYATEILSRISKGDNLKQIFTTTLLNELTTGFFTLLDENGEIINPTLNNIINFKVYNDIIICLVSPDVTLRNCYLYYTFDTSQISQTQKFIYGGNLNELHVDGINFDLTQIKIEETQNSLLFLYEPNLNCYYEFNKNTQELTLKNFDFKAKTPDSYNEELLLLDSNYEQNYEAQQAHKAELQAQISAIEEEIQVIKNEILNNENAMQEMHNFIEEYDQSTLYVSNFNERQNAINNQLLVLNNKLTLLEDDLAIIRERYNVATEEYRKIYNDCRSKKEEFLNAYETAYGVSYTNEITKTNLTSLANQIQTYIDTEFDKKYTNTLQWRLLNIHITGNFRDVKYYQEKVSYFKEQMDSTSNPSRKSSYQKSYDMYKELLEKYTAEYNELVYQRDNTINSFETEKRNLILIIDNITPYIELEAQRKQQVDIIEAQLTEKSPANLQNQINTLEAEKEALVDEKTLKVLWVEQHIEKYANSKAQTIALESENEIKGNQINEKEVEITNIKETIVALDENTIVWDPLPLKNTSRFNTFIGYSSKYFQIKTPNNSDYKFIGPVQNIDFMPDLLASTVQEKDLLVTYLTAWRDQLDKILKIITVSPKMRTLPNLLGNLISIIDTPQVDSLAKVFDRAKPTYIKAVDGIEYWVPNLHITYTQNNEPLIIMLDRDNLSGVNIKKYGWELPPEIRRDDLFKERIIYKEIASYYNILGYSQDLNFNDIQKMYIASDNNLYITTTKGIFKYNNSIKNENLLDSVNFANPNNWSMVFVQDSAPDEVGVDRLHWQLSNSKNTVYYKRLDSEGNLLTEASGSTYWSAKHTNYKVEKLEEVNGTLFALGYFEKIPETYIALDSIVKEGLFDTTNNAQIQQILEESFPYNTVTTPFVAYLDPLEGVFKLINPLSLRCSKIEEFETFKNDYIISCIYKDNSYNIYTGAYSTNNTYNGMSYIIKLNNAFEPIFTDISSEEIYKYRVFNKNITLNLISENINAYNSNDGLTSLHGDYAESIGINENIFVTNINPNTNEIYLNKTLSDLNRNTLVKALVSFNTLQNVENPLEFLDLEGENIYSTYLITPLILQNMSFTSTEDYGLANRVYAEHFINSDSHIYPTLEEDVNKIYYNYNGDNPEFFKNYSNNYIYLCDSSGNYLYNSPTEGLYETRNVDYLKDVNCVNNFITIPEPTFKTYKELSNSDIQLPSDLNFISDYLTEITSTNVENKQLTLPLNTSINLEEEWVKNFLYTSEEAPILLETLQKQVENPEVYTTTGWCVDSNNNYYIKPLNLKLTIKESTETPYLYNSVSMLNQNNCDINLENLNSVYLGETGYGGYLGNESYSLFEENGDLKDIEAWQSTEVYLNKYGEPVEILKLEENNLVPTGEYLLKPKFNTFEDLLNTLTTALYIGDFEEFSSNILAVDSKSVLLKESELEGIYEFKILTKNKITPKIETLQNPDFIYEINSEDLQIFGVDRIYIPFPFMCNLTYTVNGEVKHYKTQNNYYNLNTYTSNNKNVYLCDINGKYVVAKEEIINEDSLKVLGEEDYERVNVLIPVKEPISVKTQNWFNDKEWLDGYNPFYSYLKVEYSLDEKSYTIKNVKQIKNNHKLMYSQDTVFKNFLNATKTNNKDMYYSKGYLSFIPIFNDGLFKDNIKSFIRNTFVQEAFDTNSMCSYNINDFKDYKRVDGKDNRGKVEISNLIVFDTNDNIIGAAEFPALEYNSEDQHLSFNIVIQNT